MKFTVVWQRDAQDELTEIWLAASSEERAEITDAANSMDALLRHDPDQVGESRSEQTRIVIVRRWHSRSTSKRKIELSISSLSIDFQGRTKTERRLASAP